MSGRKRLAAAVVVYSVIKKREEILKKKRTKRLWVRNWILNRYEEGVHAKLLKEISVEDNISYENFIRMSKIDYDNLLEKITTRIVKKDTHLRKAISPRISPSERLTLTLRFLATGDSYQSLSYLFRIPPTTISRIIPEVCEALFDELKPDYIKIPATSDKWEKVAQSFDDIWNFPHCIGALDGKRIVIKAPSNSGSLYFNYKGTNSIVLMALVGAEYQFLYVDVGCNGRISDGGVFANCSLSTALENNTLNIPRPEPLRGQSNSVPYVIVADDAFPLKPYLLKPFPFRNQPAQNRIFNFRLSRARRVVENAFGLLSVRFRVLRRPIELDPEKSTMIVLATCCLHNYLLSRKDSNYAPPGIFDREEESGFIPGSWREEEAAQTSLHSMANTNLQRNAGSIAKQVRDHFKAYFISTEGELAWQYQHI